MDKIKLIAERLQTIDIESYFVGGCVRDEIMGVIPDDVDICLVGVRDSNQQQFEDILKEICDTLVPEVGNKFPTWICIISGKKYDLALARGEQKDGDSRKDFLINTFNVTIEEDLLRRDLTINAVAKHILTNEYIDPYNGIKHIHKCIAHPVSDAFKEDSLRVIRAARFIARFNLFPTLELKEMCRHLTPTDMSNERVGKELMKLFEQAEKPSRFFDFLYEVGWLSYYFKELEDLVGVEQDAEWHPEGDAFTHTMHCLDATSIGDWKIRAVMLCHDLGKSTTTKFENGRWRARGHEVAGVPLTDTMLKRIHFCDHRTINQIKLLVEMHMIHTQTISEKVVRRALRRLMNAHLPYSELVEVSRCDKSGRPPLPACTPYIGEDIAKRLLENDEMTPIVTGKLLKAHGYENYTEWGNIIKTALSYQDRGTLKKGNWKKFLRGAKLLS